MDNCFYNLPDKVKIDSGRIQYGWTIWENPGLLLEAEFHAVWVSPANDFVDITQKTDGEKQILFLPDSKRVWQKEMVDNIRLPLVDNAYTRQLILAGEAYFRLRQKYWDPETGISHIPLREAQQLMQAQVVGLTPAVADNTKIGRNQPCYCGSGRKYKKCHQVVS